MGRTSSYETFSRFSRKYLRTWLNLFPAKVSATLNLLTNFFVDDPLKTNGPMLIKSVLKKVLEIYHLPRLHQKVQQRCGGLLASIVSVTSQRVDVPPASSSKENSAMEDDTKPAEGQAKVKPKFKFNLLSQSQQDRQLQQELVQTTLLMLHPQNSVTQMQGHGIRIAEFMSDFQTDNLFISLLRLLGVSASVEIRKRIIKALKAPYSDEALAILGKRLRDVNKDVIILVFNQLTSEGVTIEDFKTAEARMLVLKQGLASDQEQVQEACISFFTPTVLKYQNSLASLLSIIDGKLSFVDQYYSRIPCLVILSIFRILEDEMAIVRYLEEVVFAKLNLMVPNRPKEDIDMKEEG